VRVDARADRGRNVGLGTRPRRALNRRLLRRRSRPSSGCLLRLGRWAASRRRVRVRRRGRGGM